MIDYITEKQKEREIMYELQCFMKYLSIFTLHGCSASVCVAFSFDFDFDFDLMMGLGQLTEKTGETIVSICSNNFTINYNTTSSISSIYYVTKFITFFFC